MPQISRQSGEAMGTILRSVMRLSEPIRSRDVEVRFRMR